MVRDIQRSLQMFDAVYRQSAKISRMIDLVNSGGAVSEIQRRQAEVSWALSSAKYDRWQQDLFRATRHLHELGRQTSVDLLRAHQSWLHEIDDVIERPTRSWILAQLTLSDISHYLTTSKLLWARIDYNALARSLNIQQATMSKIQAEISALTISYRNLTESFGSVADVVKLPSFVLPGATREVSTTGYALEVLYPFDDELETEDEESEVYTGLDGATESSALIVLLDREGSEFVVTYRGALEALNGDNPDRSRHVLSSLRTLVDHLLRKFAPRGKVREWIVERGYHSYLADGKPTRRAQILYMFKDIESEPLTKFIEADTKTVEELYTLYNRLHSLGTGISDSQLRVIVLKTESYLEYILRVREW